MTEPTQPARPDQSSVDSASNAPPAEGQSSTDTTPPSSAAAGSPADASAASPAEAPAAGDSGDAAGPESPALSGEERRVAADETTTALPPLTLPGLPPLAPSGPAVAGLNEATMALPRTGASPHPAERTSVPPPLPTPPASARPSGVVRAGHAPSIPAAEVSAALRGPVPEEDKKKPGLLGISGNQILAGALAASTSAVAASYLGVAGTVMGAGLGSVIATVSTAVYQKSIQHSRPLLQKVTTTVVGKNGELQDVVTDGLSESRAARVAPDPSLPTATQVGTGLPDPQLAEEHRSPERSASGQHPPAGASPYEETVPVMTPALPSGRAGAYGAASVPNRPTGKVYGGGPWYVGLPWKRIAVASAVVFALAMGGITTIELLTDKPLAATLQNKDTSGTTIWHSGGDDSTSTTPTPTESDDPTPTDTPSEDVTPSDSATPTDEPTDEPTPTDTGEPTTEQTPEAPAATDDQAANPTDGVVPQPQVESGTTPAPSASLLG